MSIVVLHCMSLLLIQMTSGQSLGKVYNNAIVLATAEEAALFNYNGMGLNPISNAMDYDAALAANAMSYSTNGISSGGGFKIASSSPIVATGFTIQSDNLIIEGPLAVSGQIPFLGVVSIEGPLTSVGQGSVAYGCGNGNIGIMSETESGYTRALGRNFPILPNFTNNIL